MVWRDYFKICFFEVASDIKTKHLVRWTPRLTVVEAAAEVVVVELALTDPPLLAVSLPVVSPVAASLVPWLLKIWRTLTIRFLESMI